MHLFVDQIDALYAHKGYVSGAARDGSDGTNIEDAISTQYSHRNSASYVWVKYR